MTTAPRASRSAFRMTISDDDDIVTVLIAEPDESLRDSLNQAAAICPKAAITIEG